MFVRTPRLLLRPGWSEDAPALAVAIGEEAIVRNLARAPWPYRLADAEAFLGAATEPALPSLLVFRRAPGALELIGGVGLAACERADAELGYWIARRHWGCGYATEAAGAMVGLARDTLRLGSLHAGHFVDNPASGRVLAKVGFAETGEVRELYSVGRGQTASSRVFRLSLANEAAVSNQRESRLVEA